MTSILSELPKDFLFHAARTRLNCDAGSHLRAKTWLRNHEKVVSAFM
jgi:hypothetical protein